MGTSCGNDMFIIKTANEAIKDGMREIYKENSIEELLGFVQKYATEHFDGHYSIYSFTTNYKVIFGTLYETMGLWKMEGFPTLKEALISVLVEKPSSYDYEFDINEFLGEDEVCKEYESDSRKLEENIIGDNEDRLGDMVGELLAGASENTKRKLVGIEEV